MKKIAETPRSNCTRLLCEVLFGLNDGRLFVYRTGMSLAPRDAQWPTASGNSPQLPAHGCVDGAKVS